MIFDRYYQYALLLAGFLLLSAEVKSSILSLGLALAGPLIMVVIWQRFSQRAARAFSCPKARGLRNLRQLKARPNAKTAKVKTLRAARDVLKGYGLTLSLQPQEDPRLQKLMQDVWAQENTAVIFFSAPLTAGWLGAALAQAGGLSAAQREALIQRLEHFSPKSQRINKFIELLWARNRLLSYIVAPKSDYDWIERVYNVGLEALITGAGSKRLMVLTLTITRRREDAGMDKIAITGNPIRALRPKDQRDIVLMARLLRNKTSLSTIRLTDPSRLRYMSKIAAGVVNDPPLPLDVLNPSKTKPGGATMRDAYALLQDVKEAAASPPVSPAPPDPTEAKAELEASALNAVYLKRHWPVGTPYHGNSHFGGLPSLPAHTPWPRHESNNQPLHFLAQIDCAEMPNPETPTPLPPDGMLFFFADINSDMDWGDGTKTTRVLYVPAARQVAPKSPAPHDLAEIGHNEGEDTGDYARPSIKTYPFWPLTGQTMRSYDTAYTHGDPLKNKMAEKMHSAEIQRHLPPASGETPLRLLKTTPRTDENGKQQHAKNGRPVYDYTWANPATLDPRFPYCGAVMHSFMQKMIEKPASDLAHEIYMHRYYTGRAKFASEVERASRIARADEKIARLKKRVEALEAVASKWQIVSDYTRPGATLTQEFRAWIIANAAAAERPLRNAFLAMGQRAVIDPRLHEILPESLFAAVDRDLRPRVGQSQHIMLGHPQNKTNSTQGQGVRLLLLDSDMGMDFMFCDMGVIEFYIAPEDLAKRDFSRAYANTAGG